MTTGTAPITLTLQSSLPVLRHPEAANAHLYDLFKSALSLGTHNRWATNIL